MKLMFLGTAAATACPLPFCGCPTCREARRRGGRDLRRRSSLLIDDEILIDMGPDLMSASFDFKVDTSAIGLLLQTHSHSDHFDAGHMITRIPDYATRNLKPLTILASHNCLEHMSEKLSREETGATLMDARWREKLGVQTVEMSHGTTYQYGKYTVTAVESAHDTDDMSLMYIVTDGVSSVFYACDTPLLTDRAWELLEGLGKPLSVAIIDQCYGPDTPGGGHMHANQVADCVKKLRPERAYASHISHEGTPPHIELEQWTRAHGYETAYDGLVLNF